MNRFTAIVALAIALSGFGCSRDKPENIKETVATSEATLAECKKAAGQSYDFSQATIAAKRTDSNAEAEGRGSRQEYAAALALCEQQQTNRLLAIQIEK